MRISKTLISTVASAALLLILAAPQAMAVNPNAYVCTGHGNGAAVTGTATSNIDKLVGLCAFNDGVECLSNLGCTSANIKTNGNAFVGVVDTSGVPPSCKPTSQWLAQFPTAASHYNLGPAGSEGGEGFWVYTTGPWAGCTVGVQFSAYGTSGNLTGYLYTRSTPLFAPPAAYIQSLINAKIIPKPAKGKSFPTCTAAGNVGDLGCFGNLGKKPPTLPF